MNSLFKITVFAVFISCSAAAQDTIPRVIKIDELFDLASQNSKKLSISKHGIEISRQKTEIAKSARLPELEISAKVGYISNAVVLEPNFSYMESINIPHFSNNYDFEASQLLYAGNSINASISKSELEEKLSELSYDKDSETIKIMLLGRYLELYALHNQQRVYKTNIALAKAVFKNITSLHKQGMVTKNDIIRSELQITELELQANKVDNSISIINRELCVVLGLDVKTKIIVDPALKMAEEKEETFDVNLSNAFNQTPAMRATAIQEEIAEKNIAIAKAERIPTLSLYATNGMVRPYIYVLPPLNNYVNLYQVGIKLSYNISSIYHAKEHIHLAEIQKTIQREQTELIRQQTELEVNAAYIKFREAKQEMITREKSRLLADDNYRIVEKKYLNQLALFTDMLDASSAKLSAELNHSNAGITVVYQWYELQKATGKL
ncbi:TolC family protein [Flavobacterium sp. DG1-102-2]|uniref:TolC family protein n=1 Tax=Flavobacterium sp. DG1-102-2 TaxID=3081663 RepID=UPI00294954CA|nr:TolC family protein [Flavobacterium sp. DG1-102-2]MDV6167000.1 TolC family protein [Flavobacterium sp. DG1-102-2]